MRKLKMGALAAILLLGLMTGGLLTANPADASVNQIAVGGPGTGGGGGPATNSLELKALNKAMTKRGDPYVWGATGPNAFDCSGLIVWAYRAAGLKNFPRYTAAGLWNRGWKPKHLRKGDLLFFYSGPDHVGIYIGHGKMLDAPHTGANVRIDDVYWNVYDGAKRLGWKYH